MEEELLVSEAGEEAVADETRCSWVGVVGDEWGESLAGYHHWDSAAFKLLLAEHDWNLGVVDVWALGAGDGHHAEVVVWESFHETF